MFKFDADFFILLMLKVYILRQEMNCLSTKYGVDKELSDDERQQVNILLEVIDTQCERFDLNRSKSHVSRMTGMVARGCRVGKLSELITGLRERIEDDLSTKHFMYIPSAEADYYDQPELFGHEVYENFESTRADVREAGNCYAVGRNTACVFHCMRVLEKGLHALVHQLNNDFSTNIDFRKGIDHTNWGNIIEKIESEFKELLKPTRQPRLTQSDLQFFSEAAKEFVYFKLAWRDDVSHSRSSYDRIAAKDVLEHVRAFMRHLSSRLHE